MRKLITLLIALLVVSLLTSGVYAADFRDVNWGMTKNEVRERESMSPVEVNQRSLFYEVNINDTKYVLGYWFWDNTLIEAKYVSWESVGEGFKFKAALNNLYDMLKDKYGTGNEELDPIWVDDLYKNDPSSWDTAVLMDQVLIFEMFDTEETEIFFSVDKMNYRPIFVIQYTSKEHADLFEARKEYEENKNKSQL